MPGRRSGPEPEGWLFIRTASVPEPWQKRAIAVSLIPLFPGEVHPLFGRKALPIELDPVDARLVALLARGLRKADIAVTLGVSQRSVERRLSKLRAAFGVESTTALVAMLASRGFGGVENAT